MNVTELIAECRRRLDDTVAPFLWSDAELLAHLNEAEREAALRARLLTDSTTANVAVITLVAGQAAYTVSPLVIEIRRAKVDGQYHTLTHTSPEALDRKYIDWETRQGDPAEFFEQSGQIQLVPVPRENGTLRLVVYRYPLTAMVMPTDPETPGAKVAPELPAEFHEQLVPWALHRAYLKRDNDTYDETRSNAHLAEFAASFGERPDANTRRKQREKRPRTTKFIPF